MSLAPQLSDNVTGLAGEPLVWQMVEHGVARARRDDRSLAVMCIYLEGIAGINERYGPHAGDRAIALVARRLATLLRASDTVGRIGGTRLAVILSAMARTADVQLVAEKILDTIGEPIALNGSMEILSASVGVALYPTTAEDAEGLIRAATAAMDAAEGQGDGQLLFA